MHEGEGHRSDGAVAGGPALLLVLALLAGGAAFWALTAGAPEVTGAASAGGRLGDAERASVTLSGPDADSPATALAGDDAELPTDVVGEPGAGREGAQIVVRPDGSAPSLARGTAGIRGRVVDSAGRGVPGARVQVRSQPGAGGGMRQVKITRGPGGQTQVERAGEQRSAAVETDAQGRYTLGELPAELRGVLQVEPPAGYLGAQAPLPALVAHAVTEVDDVLVRRPASLSGVVVDEAGQPIADAGVQLAGELPFLLFEEPDADEPPDGEARTTTRALRVVASAGGAGPALNLDAAPPPATRSDDQGRWRLEGVQPGEHTVIARKRGRRTARLDDVEAREGQETADLRLELAAGYTLSVDCVDAQGRPVAGARVDAFGLRQPGRGPRAETDAAGRAVLEGLAEAGLRLVVEAEGMSPHSQQLTLEGEGDRVEVVLRPGVTLEGRAVRDADGSPVAGAFAWVEPLVFEGGRLEIRAGDEDGRAGDDGRFRLRGVAPGSYRLHVRAPGLAEATRDLLVDPAPGPVDLGEVRLPALCALEVTVLDPAGQPVAGAEVSTGHGLAGGMAVMVDVQETDGAGEDEGEGAPGGRMGLPGLGQARSDGEGRATLQGLDPGEVTVEARKPGFGTGRAAPVTLAPGERGAVTVRLELAARVEGTLLQADGLPAPAEPLVLAPEQGSPASAETDAEGRFVFADVAPGRYRLRASRRALDASSGAAFDVPAGQTTRRPARLVPGARLAGVVRGPDGAPLANARVVYGRLLLLADAAPEVVQPVAEARTDAQGRYAFEDLVPGAAEHGLSVRPSGAEQGVAFAVQVAAGGSTRDLRLPGPGGAAVTVGVQDGGAPAAGARVELAAVGDGPLLQRSRTTGSDGQLAFEDVPPGRYALRAELDGRARACAEVTVEGTGPVQAPALRLCPEGALLLQVDGVGDLAWPVVRLEVTRADAPLDARQLMLRPGEPTRVGGLTPDATYRLRVSAPGREPRELEAQAVAAPSRPLRIDLAD